MRASDGEERPQLWNIWDDRETAERMVSHNLEDIPTLRFVILEVLEADK
jgi:hypothetical protein